MQNNITLSWQSGLLAYVNINKLIQIEYKLRRINWSYKELEAASTRRVGLYISMGSEELSSMTIMHQAIVLVTFVTTVAASFYIDDMLMDVQNSKLKLLGS